MKKISSSCSWQVSLPLLIIFSSLSLFSQSPAGIKGEKIWFKPGVSFLGQSNELDSTAKDTITPKTCLFNFHDALIFHGQYGIQDSLPTNLKNVMKVEAYLIYKSEDDPTERSLWSLQTSSMDISMTTDSIQAFGKGIPYERGHTTIPVMSRYYERWRKLPKIENVKAGNTIYLGMPAPKDSLSQKFKGAIAEFIFYDRKLRSQERAVLETYLALKYGITISHDYVASEKDVLWSVEDNENYLHRIAGIGKDSLIGIHQRQATAVETKGALTISAGILQETNKMNTAAINQGDFLIWGDNNGAIQTPASKETGLPHLDRIWLMQASGDTSNTISTEVHIDPSHFFSNTENETNEYVLLINRDASETFNPESIEILYADTESQNGKYVFKNVLWDTDNSGTDSFSFMQLPVLQIGLESLEKTDCKSTAATDGILYNVTGGLPPYWYEVLNAESNYQKAWNGKKRSESEGSIDHPDAGHYIFTVSDVLGKQAQDSITIKSYIPLQIELGANRVLGNSEIVLDASSLITETDITYAWESTSGLTYSEAALTIKEHGTYMVTATDRYGCTATDEVTIFPTMLENFIVYPNISEDGNYVIQVSLKEPSAGLRLGIYDLHGQLIHTQKIDSQSTYYQFQGKVNGPSGFYTIHLSSPNMSTTAKFIKK